LRLSATDLDFRGVPERGHVVRDLTIRNEGRRTLEVLAFDATPPGGTGTWIVPSPARFSLPAGGEQQIKVHLHAGKTLFGSEVRGRLEVAADRRTQAVELSVALEPPAWRRRRVAYPAMAGLFVALVVAVLVATAGGSGSAAAEPTTSAEDAVVAGPSGAAAAATPVSSTPLMSVDSSAAASPPAVARPAEPARAAAVPAPAPRQAAGAAPAPAAAAPAPKAEEPARRAKPAPRKKANRKTKPKDAFDLKLDDYGNGRRR
jgi:hypothetical protein